MYGDMSFSSVAQIHLSRRTHRTYPPHLVATVPGVAARLYRNR
jgi:hypothetical protein